MPCHWEVKQKKLESKVYRNQIATENRLRSDEALTLESPSSQSLHGCNLTPINLFDTKCLCNNLSQTLKITDLMLIIYDIYNNFQITVEDLLKLSI